MWFIFSIVKNIIAVIAIVAIVLFALKYAPFLKDQEWNPVHDDKPSMNNEAPQQNLTGGKRYSVEDNDILNNVPFSQTKNVFDWINKKEFMSVSGLERMGYTDEYLAGQRGDEFIIYKFGSDSLRVYKTEIEMEQDLNQLGAHIELQPQSNYE
ncbi:hypothetical protein A4A32_11645 [Staphylococcus equorum]|uniref:DUF4930 family protein n=1 Tax=Staphylococcus TaxID=1279 RepID=UPI0007EA4EA3|nr:MULTISPECIES: DUF4930 family protein [Staphylococcus]ANK37092.1 hypothetical protein AOB58_290 [Staphylococcus sp. AntiMn-1]MCZ4235613.1 DUF4930 family protein [Staphylococcus equorum]OIS53367.1 hypothetical protein A4A29_01280 [Staphylococcus equorum]OIS56181.1 hypothetical protein A4A32_11645 [Staphylococcus equorum]QHD15433.1 DUF4930 family protein [Staphylococcus equorum]